MSVSLGAKKETQSGGERAKPLDANEVAAYYQKLNELTGGRLNEFSTTGTPQLSSEQIQAVGGLGADRQRQLDLARKQAVDQITADPNLTIAQRQRSTQLTGQDYNDRQAALLKEIEGQKTGLAQYNAGLTAQDLAFLANIYFGGKGQYGTQAPTTINKIGAQGGFGNNFQAGSPA